MGKSPSTHIWDFCWVVFAFLLKSPGSCLSWLGLTKVGDPIVFVTCHPFVMLSSICSVPINLAINFPKSIGIVLSPPKDLWIFITSFRGHIFINLKIRCVFSKTFSCCDMVALIGQIYWLYSLNLAHRSGGLHPCLRGSLYRLLKFGFIKFSIEISCHFFSSQISLPDSGQSYKLITEKERRIHIFGTNL